MRTMRMKSLGVLGVLIATMLAPSILKQDQAEASRRGRATLCRDQLCVSVGPRHEHPGSRHLAKPRLAYRYDGEQGWGRGTGCLDDALTPRERRIAARLARASGAPQHRILRMRLNGRTWKQIGRRVGLSWRHTRQVGYAASSPRGWYRQLEFAWGCEEMGREEGRHGGRRGRGKPGGGRGR